MNEQILIVDDEQEILASFRRQFRKTFKIETANSAKEGLTAISAGGVFAVIVSDYQMPDVDGIRFLAESKRISPKSSRIMLTGQADLTTAMNAVNEGHIFRFLTKPCPEDVFIKTVRAGIEQHRLLMAEEELLEKTLSGSMSVLMEILGLMSPEFFARAIRIRRYVNHMVSELGVPFAWQFELAAMLALIGYVTVPAATVRRQNLNQALSPQEIEIISNHPSISRNLLSSIPRLGTVARILESQGAYFSRRFDNEDFQGEDLVSLGGNLIQLAMNFDKEIMQGNSVDSIVNKFLRSDDQYYPDAVRTLRSFQQVNLESVGKHILVHELNTNMILNQDIITKEGEVIAIKGQEVTYTMLQRLRAFSKCGGITEPFEVLERKEDIVPNLK